MFGLSTIKLELRTLFSRARRGTWANIDRYTLSPIGDNLWQYHPDPGPPLKYTRHNGSVIELATPFQTDLASVPHILESIPGLGKTDLGPAAIVHDWLYQTHHLGQDRLSFEESNKCLEEMLLTLQAPYRVYSRCEALVIRDACDLFGGAIWDGAKK